MMKYRYPGRARKQTDWSPLFAGLIGWLFVAFVLWAGWGTWPW